MNTIELFGKMTNIILHDGPTIEEFKEFTIIVNELACKFGKNKIINNQIQSLKNEGNF